MFRQERITFELISSIINCWEHLRDHVLLKVLTFDSVCRNLKFTMDSGYNRCNYHLEISKLIYIYVCLCPFELYKVRNFILI